MKVIIVAVLLAVAVVQFYGCAQVADTVSGTRSVEQGELVSIPLDVEYYPKRVEVQISKRLSEHFTSPVAFWKGEIGFCGTKQLCASFNANLLPGVYEASVEDKTTSYAGVIGFMKFRVLGRPEFR